MEVGARLEGFFVDAFVSYIERDQMAPFFRANRIADGVVAATEMIVKRAQNARDNKACQDVRLSGSTGVGATVEALINRLEPDHPALEQVNPGTSPHQTLESYFKAMSQRNLRADLEIYTRASGEMMANRVITPTQADKLVRAAGKCLDGEVLTNTVGTLAVIRYAAASRQCHPYFFRHGAGAWRLDFTIMQKVIRFGVNNAWHFVTTIDHPYAFAFADWQFSAQGYPLIP